MSILDWLSLLGICLLGAMSPGPSLAVVMNATLRGGPSSGYRAAIAHGCGVALYGVITITGLAVAITRSPLVYQSLQLAGAAYLLYLGIKSLRASFSSAAAPTITNSHTPPGDSGSGRDWREGFLVAFLNPKLAVFMLALFSQFLQPGFGLIEKSIMVATVGITDASWYALMTRTIANPQLMERLKRHSAMVDRLFGVLLIGLAISVAVAAIGIR